MKLSAVKLQSRLVLFGFFLILGMIIVSFLLVYQAVKKELTAHLQSDMTSTDLVLKKFIDDRYRHLLAEGEVIANDPRFFASMVDGDRQTAQAEAERFQRIINSDLLIVCDHQARLLALVLPFNQGVEAGPIEQFFKKSGDSQPRGLLEIGGKVYQVAQTPLLAAGQGHIGKLILGFAVDSALAQTLKELTHSEVVFFLGEKPLASTLSDERSERLAEKLFLSPDLHKTTELSLDDKTFLVLAEKLEAENLDYPLVYGLLRSRNELVEPVMGEVKRKIFKSFFVLILLGLFITILGSLFLSIRIGTRLDRLVTGAHQISSGNLDFNLATGPDDEIGRLAEAFNQMRIALKNRLEELKEAHAKAMREDRLGIVGQMASTIIHDFRGPMQIIQGSAELLSMPGAPEEKKQRHSKIIVQQVERMADMAQELLDFAKGESRTRKSILAIDDLLTVLNVQADEFCRNSLVKFRADLNKPFQIWADKEKLLRVLANLVKNAKEAMPGGGQINVTAFLHGAEGVIQVSDDGPGLAPEITGRLFEPFATFGKKGGTGLGLALSKKIIDDHGGTIQCESEPDRGTTFTIRLPAGEKVILETQPASDTAKVVI